MVSLPDFPIALKEESVGQEQVRNQAAQAEPETESEEPSHPLLGENRHQGSPILPGKQGHRRRSESPFEGRFRHFPGRLERRPAQEKRRPEGGEAPPGRLRRPPSSARTRRSPRPAHDNPRIRRLRRSDGTFRCTPSCYGTSGRPPVGTGPTFPRRPQPPGSPPRRSRCARERRRGAPPSVPGTGGNPLRPIAPGKRPLPRTVPSPPRPHGQPHNPPWRHHTPPHRA